MAAVIDREFKYGMYSVGLEIAFMMWNGTETKFRRHFVRINTCLYFIFVTFDYLPIQITSQMLTQESALNQSCENVMGI